MIASGGLWRLEISERAITAINGAVALASEPKGGACEAGEIAAQTGAPVGELKAVFEQLRRAGLVEANGNGTVSWRRDPAEVSLYEIAAAVGERFGVCCSAKDAQAPAAKCSACVLNAATDDMKAQVVGLFKSRKLDHLLPGRA